MNETFELSQEGKDAIEKIRAIGGRLCDNYDPEVIAFEAGTRIGTITWDIINSNKANLATLKGLGENLMACYDDEVLAQVLELLQKV